MVNLRVDGVMVLTGIALLGGVYLYSKQNAVKKVFTEKLNPASNKNIIYNTIGQGGNPELAESDDKFFAYATIYNPFTSKESKQRARDLLDVFYPD